MRGKREQINVVKIVCSVCGNELKVESREFEEGVFQAEVSPCQNCMTNRLKAVLHLLATTKSSDGKQK